MLLAFRRAGGRSNQVKAAILHHGEGRQRGVVRNLSEKGAMFDGAPELRPGAQVVVEIQGLGPLDATVAWSVGTRCGLAFSEPAVCLPVQSRG